jgi:hypothetical protein
MYDVYGSMAQDIQLKRNFIHTFHKSKEDNKVSEKIQKEVEKDQVTQDIIRLEEEIRRKKEEEIRVLL